MKSNSNQTKSINFAETHVSLITASSSFHYVKKFFHLSNTLHSTPLHSTKLLKQINNYHNTHINILSLFCIPYLTCWLVATTFLCAKNNPCMSHFLSIIYFMSASCRTHHDISITNLI